MRLLILYPHVARVSCAECKRWVYSDWERKLTRTGEPIEREPGSSLPCDGKDGCPKAVNPIQGAKVDATLGRASALMRLWHQSTVSGGRCLSRQERRSDVLRRDLGIVDQVMRRAQLEQLRTMIRTATVETITKLKG